MASKDDAGSVSPDVLSTAVAKIVNSVILGALAANASDIHLEPHEDADGDTAVLVRYRVDGVLKPSPFRIPWAFRHAVMSKIKLMTNAMDIAQHKVPQSGRIKLVHDGKRIELEVHVIPTIHGEECAMRFIEHFPVELELAALGLLPDTLERLRSVLVPPGKKKNGGIVLFCGAARSGMTTMLYAALNHLNGPGVKIATAECPVEKKLDGVTQVEVTPKLQAAGALVNFAEALKTFERLDADVILISWFKDRGTFEPMIRAAARGRLVLTSIHANDAVSAIDRLGLMGIDAKAAASGVRAVLAQRLARRLCVECRKAREPEPEELEAFERWRVPLLTGSKLYEEGSCAACKGLGFKGYVGVQELLILSEPGAGRKLPQDALEKAKRGLTTVREALETAASS